MAATILQLFWMCLLVAGTHGRLYPWEGLQDGIVRLVNGSTTNEGRVEVFYKGRWGTVCDDRWDLADAQVVCRSLGFENATMALGKAAFGPGTGPIMLDNLECVGTEMSLAECKSQGWLQSNCRHGEDASVVCTNSTTEDVAIHTLDLSSELSKAMARVFDSQQDCNLTIQVYTKGEEALSVCAHSLILSANPEAQQLLAAGSNVTMEVDSLCLPLVKDFIRYLYSHQVNVSVASVKCFHHLASTHGASRLRDYCSRLFVAVLPQDPSFQKPLDLHAYALASGDTMLEALCVQFLAWNFGALTRAEAWRRVPLPLLNNLLSSSELVVSSEMALLKAVDAWGWENYVSHAEVVSLLEKVRFPMMPPIDLFQLQFNMSLLLDHEALFQKWMLQALEFHMVPFPLLARYWGQNITKAIYQPRIYTAPSWSASLTGDHENSQLLDTAPTSSSYTTDSLYTRAYTPAPSDYRRRPHQSFQTPEHPSFLFHAGSLSWSLYYLSTVDSCRNYGFSCSSDQLPALGLTRSTYHNPAVTFENKALVVCGRSFVAAVTDFKDDKAPLPGALRANSSGSPSFFSCPAGSTSSFYAIVRPFYQFNVSEVY